jgi:hypothetical protein
MSDLLKLCSCGCGLTVDEWEALPFVGYQVDDEEILELRNHDCGSTIALSLTEES